MFGLVGWVGWLVGGLVGWLFGQLDGWLCWVGRLAGLHLVGLGCLVGLCWVGLGLGCVGLCLVGLGWLVIVVGLFD